jgi:hypothetical protein
VLPSIEIRVVKTFEPGAQRRLVEVDEQAGREIREPQVSHHLCLMARMQGFHCLQFDNQPVINH